MSHTHTSFFKGSKIRIILKDGTQIVAKFIDKINHRSLKIELTEPNGTKRMTEVLQKDLRSANYYKPLPHERS